MGWMRTILLGDIGNRLDIADTEVDLAKVKSRQKMAERKLAAKDLDLETLKSHVARQQLAIEALTRFLVEKKVIDQDELDAFVKEVDAEDGVIDGKLTLDPVKRRLVFE